MRANDCVNLGTYLKKCYVRSGRPADKHFDSFCETFYLGFDNQIPWVDYCFHVIDQLNKVFDLKASWSEFLKFESACEHQDLTSKRVLFVFVKIYLWRRRVDVNNNKYNSYCSYVLELDSAIDHKRAKLMTHLNVFLSILLELNELFSLDLSLIDFKKFWISEDHILDCSNNHELMVAISDAFSNSADVSMKGLNN